MIGLDRKIWKTAGLVTIGLTLVASVTLCLITVASLKDIPHNLTTLSDLVDKPQLLDRDRRPLTVTYQNDWNAHQVAPLHAIPTFLQRSFILAEDKRFYQHSGIDWSARLQALWQNIVAMRGVRGASTISEQVVRMVNPRPRTVWSRWLEGWEARRLEQAYDKATILEFYLNQVPYAAQRRGVVQAARYYFDRDLDTLSEKEMMALSILVRAPSRLDLHKDSTRIEPRLRTLLQRALDQGMVGESTARRILEEPIQVSTPAPMLDVKHFARQVYRHDNATDSVKSITTTLDSGLQHFGQNLLNQRLADLSAKRVANAGLMVVDHKTSEVLVWAIGEASGAGSDDKQAGSAGSAYDSILAQRQPGSTLKPFVYAAAIEKGWTAATVIDDSPLQEAVGRGSHSYRNYSNSHYGDISLREALGNSLNIPAIKAAQYVGLNPLLEKLKGIGLEELKLRPLDYGNGIALGNGEVSLFSLVQAYAVFARGGQFEPLRLVAGDSAARATIHRRPFSREVSSIIGNILSDADARRREFGGGGTLALPVQTAVKTGTSNDYRDAWVVGYNHRYVVGVWMGNLDNQPMDQITGSTGPALVLRSMFSELNRNRDTKPLYLSPKLMARDICIGTEVLANGKCASRTEWFLPNNLPKPHTAKADEPRYFIAQPTDQLLMAKDPRIPDNQEAFEFRLNRAEGVRKVEWLLNNTVVASTAGAAYMWPIQRGDYQLSARLYLESDEFPRQLSAHTFTVK